MKNLICISLFLSLLSFMNCQPEIKKWELSSPDGNLMIRLIHQQEKREDGPRLSYEVIMKTGEGDRSVLLPSELGIIIDADSLSENLHFLSEENEVEINESYDLVTGKKLHIQNTGYGKTVIFRDAKDRQLAIDLRIYNDGVGFRYRLPESGNDSLITVTGEITTFNVGKSGNAWIQPYDTVTTYTPAYEPFYGNRIPVGSHSPGQQGWAFPALFENNGIWILLTESNLGKNFYGAHLEPSAEDGEYRIRLPEKEEAMDTGPVEPTGS
ncbi:MAG: glycoside hydrolase family 97 N-terminal domain-containing protein, partial [Cyclobacteriaceae bacterium]|nr:glycoside hydrolase family 97 N-terminal domain-containing protein [Cyclobacteriaceae bacterium]